MTLPTGIDNPLGVERGQRWRHSPPDRPVEEYTVTRLLSKRKAIFFAQYEGFTVKATVHLDRMTADEWERL